MSMRLLCLLLSGVLVLSACAEDERRGIRLTPTSTVETNVRALVDNCPGPATIALLVRDDVLWEIEAPPVTDSPESVADGEPEEQLDAIKPPGIAEFVIGQAPEGWSTTTALSGPLEPGIRYTVKTEPDGQSVDFSTPDLAGGLLWDGAGNSRFNPNLVNVECSEPADIDGFVRNIGILALLAATAAALVLVALILLLFVITRRFSRIRSLQTKARQEPRQKAGKPQRPKVRAKN